MEISHKEHAEGLEGLGFIINSANFNITFFCY